MKQARRRGAWLLACTALWLCSSGRVALADAVPEDLPPAAEQVPSDPSAAVDPPQSHATADSWLSPLGPGTGPGLPWPLVLAVQLMVFVAADVVPFVSCVGCSWGLGLLVPLGPGLPLALLFTVLFIPPAALLSGCCSAAALQFVGDRFGILRGRLACVGLTSVLLSFITYALVIAPIILGVGFFAVALATFLSASALLVLPQFGPPGPNGVYSALGYSVSAVGAVVATAALLVGLGLSPVLGFVVRPVLVTLAYRLSGRPREPGEEQWPPSLFGERADRWPRPWRKSPPAVVAPVPVPPPEAPVFPPPGDDVAPPPLRQPPAPTVGLNF